jgi:putative phage-type endonuclease
MEESLVSTQPQHHVVGMSFDAAKLEERRKYLGASEIPAVAGLNPRKSALDVYLEKRGIVAPFMGNQFTEWGLRLEGAIRQKYVEVTGAVMSTTPESDVRCREDFMACTPDGIVLGREGHFIGPVRGLEIKRFADYRADDFGVPGTGEVPLDVTAQCLWSMAITELRAWDVAVLIGQADFRIYHIDWDAAAAATLLGIGYDFWHKNVLAEIEPPITGTESAQKYLQQKYATHSAEMIEPTVELIEAGRHLATVKAELKALDMEKSELEHRIQQAIGDAAGIRNVATWKLDKTGRCSWKNVAETLGATKPENASLIQRYTSAPSRRFRLLVEED